MPKRRWLDKKKYISIICRSYQNFVLLIESFYWDLNYHKLLLLKSYFIDEVFYYFLQTLSFQKLKRYVLIKSLSSQKLKRYILIKFKCNLSWICCLIVRRSMKIMLNFENPTNDFSKCIHDRNVFLPHSMYKMTFFCVYLFLS